MQFIDSTAITNKLAVNSLVEALRDGFRSGCEMPVRHRHTLERNGEPPASLVLMPAWQADGTLGVKMTTIVPGNVDRQLPSRWAIYVLFDPVTGEPTHALDGHTLTLHRTAAASALAATYLARKDAKCLVMVGTGTLAPYLIKAHCAVRPIEKVAIWGRRPERAQAVAAGRPAGDAVQHIVATDLATAIRGADIISCATLASDPLVMGDWLSPGAHLDLVGGFTPSMREADDEAIRRARIFVDKKESCLIEAGDLVQPIKAGILKPEDVAGDLFDLCRGTVEGRRSADEITVFKSVGIAIEDLVAANLVACTG
ncbi:ornithine cyclodeaminase family protein [Microvirga massiliensis]|uniref:ornithine cyclodeaminase family protein n=1 Tax=Microvirga massiliensis TaxID=1033741 RepID=UPI00062BBD51|nr:ornithine cyclodeaminase family protein [Microvirga massiliensis]